MTTDSTNRQDPPALQQALRLFREGKYDEAFRGFELLGDASTDEGAFYVAWMLKEGKGVTRDLGRARRLFIGLAEKGGVESMYYLGTIAEMEGNAEQALTRYAEAASRDYLLAIYSLGRLYIEGPGVPADLAKGRHHLERAIERGHVFAMRKLAGLMLRGRFGFALLGRGAVLFLRSVIQAVRLLLTDPTDDRLRAY